MQGPRAGDGSAADMKLSSKTDYALKTMLDLAMHGNERVVRVGDIAQRQSIPIKFLEQILLVLKAGGLVASRRGARGGYVLAKKSSAIAIGDIVRLTENSFAFSHPTKSPYDPFGEVWEDIGNYADKKLADTKLQDICARVLELRQGKPLEYTI